MEDGRGCRACRSANWKHCKYERVRRELHGRFGSSVLIVCYAQVASGDVCQIEIQSPSYSDTATQMGFPTLPNGERFSILAPMRSDPSQSSISSPVQSHPPALDPCQRPMFSDLSREASDMPYQMRRPLPAPASGDRLDQSNIHQQTSISSSRSPAPDLPGRAGSPTWGLHYQHGGFTSNTPSFPTEGFPPYIPGAVVQTTSSADYSPNVTIENSSYFPGMSPLGRHLPQPISRGTGPRDSISSNQGHFLHAHGQNSGYSNESYDREPVSSETRRESITSSSQDAGRTTPSSPKDAHQTTFDYASGSRSPSEMAKANQGAY